MEFNKFTMSSMKIKSNWFDGKRKSIFQRIGKEEGLNLYLQLFRHRLHQGNYNEHVFKVTIGELVEHTKVNLTRKLTRIQIITLLKKMESVGIIKLITPYRWDQIEKDGIINHDKLIMLQATDVPNINRVNDVDSPVSEDDYYISIFFDVVIHMYDELKLSSKDVAIYLLFLKLSNGGERKATININTMKEWLGYGNETIKSILITLNTNKMVATYPRRKGKVTSFEHVPIRSYSNENQKKFNDAHSDAIRIFLKRYEVKEDVPEDVLKFSEKYDMTLL